MTDKQRHRRARASEGCRPPAPHGYLPNWLLVVFFIGAVAVASLAHNFV